MAYVITAVGAGGKTTYLMARAREYMRQGKKTALTTTTHIWPPDIAAHHAEDHCDKAMLPDYFGSADESGKLSAPDEDTYARICREYDVVLVEGDGSHCMPVKIPRSGEPVIPQNTNEIVVVMGAHAIGRRMDAVCQRYDRSRCGRYADRTSMIPEQAMVTEQMLWELAEQEYIIPLRQKYPDAGISYFLSRMPESDRRLTGVLMASGFGRRFGSNKLIAPFGGKALYRHSLDSIIGALGAENTVVVTQYKEIMEEASGMGAEAVENDMASEGIAASIRIGTMSAVKRGSDAVMFFASDMPYLPSGEIRMFADQFLSSKKAYGCMEFGKEHTCTNPGAFLLEDGAEKLLQLTGDRGAMRIMKQEPWNIYYYQIPAEYAVDIDVSPLQAAQNQTL